MGKKKGKGKGKKAAAPPPEEEAPAPAPAADADMDDDYLFHPPQTEVVKPDSQLDLTEEELKVAHPRSITWRDPNVPSNVCKFSFKEKKFKKDPPGSNAHLAVHFSMDGCMLHVGSEDAKAQLAREEAKRDAEAEAEKRRKVAETKASAGAGDDDIMIEKVAASDTSKNQFNYSERACQTFNNPLRQRWVSTQPPPMETFTASVTQWKIYDSYMADFEAKRRQAALDEERRRRRGSSSKSGKSGADADGDEDVVHSAAMGSTLRVLERMVNQNREDEIYQDFKYWEDLSDTYRDGEGSLLPLWRFASDRTKHKQVTSIAWHPKFTDLFAVGFGSYNFMQQGSGLIFCYSLKNTAYPEFTFSTESGVMSVDWHPQHHALLAVGCYDGTVQVFDVRKKENKPIYISTVRTGKHTDPVWQVCWQEEDLAKELNFFSISSDGRVADWLMTNTELKMETVMSLKLITKSEEADFDEEASLSGLASGCCFDFNRVSEHLFIVGTEEGKLHKCSKAYSGQYLKTYEGHHMAVYGCKWNEFHPRIFLSCSADWAVKLWDHNLSEPIMSFDLGEAVGDIAWSPYSSTVFCAVTSDGKVHVYDLSVNKHEPIAEQKVVKRSKLTHVVFNRGDPIILVGDERGGVISLKLSPNLRKAWYAVPVDGKITPEKTAEEIERLNKVLASVDSSMDLSDVKADASVEAK